MIKSVALGALTAILVFLASLLVGYIVLSLIKGGPMLFGTSGGECSTDPSYWSPEETSYCNRESLKAIAERATLVIFGLGAPVFGLAAGVLVIIRREKQRRNVATIAGDQG